MLEVVPHINHHKRNILKSFNPRSKQVQTVSHDNASTNHKCCPKLSSVHSSSPCLSQLVYWLSPLGPPSTRMNLTATTLSCPVFKIPTLWTCTSKTAESRSMSMNTRPTSSRFPNTSLQATLQTSTLTKRDSVLKRYCSQQWLRMTRYTTQRWKRDWTTAAHVLTVCSTGTHRFLRNASLGATSSVERLPTAVETMGVLTAMLFDKGVCGRNGAVRFTGCGAVLMAREG
jgi:hypothetical protein